MRRPIALIALALLLGAGRCHAPAAGGGGYVDDGAFKRPPTPIPAVPLPADQSGVDRARDLR